MKTILITLVNHIGSSPQDVGAKAFASVSGLVTGTVGGGKIEARAISHAKEMLENKTKHDFKQWNLQTDIGMTCGGVVSFYFEEVDSQSDWHIAIFGAGHVSQQLTKLLCFLDCQLTVIDSRSEWLDKIPAHPRLTKRLEKNMADALSQLQSNCYIISVTMGHGFDLPILEKAMSEFNFPYIGAIGSEQKAKVLKRDLLQKNINEKKVNSLYCPIGENFGSNDPAEIAFSIIAQLLKLRPKR
jgi:xanthine dehydrogenase accessory factor